MFDQRAAASDSTRSRVAPENLARVVRLPDAALVYEVRDASDHLEMVVLPVEGLDMLLDLDVMAEAGAMFGSGGLIVCNEDRSVVDLTRNLLAFDQMESCGKCFPCRLGMSHLLEVLDRLCAGQGVPEDMALMERIGSNMTVGSLCGHGQLGYNPVASAVKFFGPEFAVQCDAHTARDLGTLVSPRASLRGAQLDGETPTAVVKADFVARPEPVGGPAPSGGAP